jgi:hypothetical protein
MFSRRFSMKQVVLYVYQEKEESGERLVTYSFPD